MWFVRVGAQVTGPFSMEQLRAMRRRGEFSPVHQVSTDRIRWESAAQLVQMLDGPRSSGGQPAAGASSAAAAASPGAAGSGQWFYLTRGRHQVGPLDEESLRQLLASRTLAPKTMVWRDGEPTWQQARQRSEFSGAIPATGFSRPLLIGGPLVAVAVAAGVAAVLLPGRSQQPDELAQKPAAAILPAAEAAGVAASVTAAPQESAQGVPPAKESTGSKPPPPGAAQAVGSGKPEGKPPEPADPAPTPSAAPAAEPAPAGGEHHDSLLIDADSDDETIGQAVGFAVICERYVLPGGATIEKPTVSGSCFAVTPSGYFLTNRHVVEDMRPRKSGKLKIGKKTVSIEVETAMVVYFGSKHVRYEGKLIFQSKHFDMAIVKLDRTHACPYFALSKKHEAKDFKRSMAVRAIGFPGIAARITDPAEAAAIEARVNQGFVEALEHQSTLPAETFLSDNSYLHSQTEGSISRPAKDPHGATVLHHGAKIFHGNSGGPLVDTSGTVVGINTWGYSAQSDTLYVAAAVGEMREEINEYLPERDKILWRD